METISALLALCGRNSPVNYPHKGQWRGAMMFSLICAWRNDWVNNREAGDLRCHRALWCHSNGQAWGWYWPINRHCVDFHFAMMTSSIGNIFRVTGHLCGEFTGLRWIPRTKASDGEHWYFFYLRLNQRLSKQWRSWWFETLSCQLWHQCNGKKHAYGIATLSVFVFSNDWISIVFLTVIKLALGQFYGRDCNISQYQSQ